MTIAFQSERRRGLFVLQLARAGDYEAATTQKNDEVKKWRFFKIQNTVKVDNSTYSISASNTCKKPRGCIVMIF